MKKYVTLFGVLFVMLAVAACGKDTPSPTPTTAPTVAAPQEKTPTPELPEEIPSLAKIAVESEILGEEATKLLLGVSKEKIVAAWGEPLGTWVGFSECDWDLDGERKISLSFDAEGIVYNVRIAPWAEQTTPAPTDAPKDEPTFTPTPTPTTAPDAPFAMVSPVPQSEVVDIVGTMTVETYPVVDGSTATLPLSEAVFMAATGESAEVAAQQVVHTKTTNSYNRLYNGEVDLLIVYEPAETIVERMKTEPLCIKPIGLDALVFLANTANPLSSLTMEQLVDIYSGKISNWSEVGGLDKELLAFQRPVGSGSQTLMQKLVMKDVAMTEGDNVFRYSTMSDILEGMLSYNNEDNTLGYSVFYYANNMYFEKDLKLMGVDGVLPSTQTIYDGSYKLTNSFYAVVRPDEPADSNARKLFDWLTGEAGQQLVLDLGYVPVQMPAGADISDVKVVQQEKVEILAKEPLKEGEYFVFANQQNMVSDYYYGDITIYNYKWEEVANFYNVTLNHGIQGIYTNRYLPIGQIRLNEAGEQKVLYGIFDLEMKTYSIVPSYKGMEMLDVEKGYYVVPPENMEEDYSWMNWSIINGTGEVLLDKVEMSDWLTISKFGNGYMEMSYDYSNWDNGMTYRYYDANLKLKKVYCQYAAAMPDDADMVEGVDYILLEDSGCLVNADGEVILNWATFLDKYGDGENMKIETQFYTITLAEEGKCYPVLYKNAVYLFDSNMNLLRVSDNPFHVNSFSDVEFHERFFLYWDEFLEGWTHGTYEDTDLMMSDGVPVETIYTHWNNDGYLMCRLYGNHYFVEEYTPDGDLYKFNVEVLEEMISLVVSYSEAGYVVLDKDFGEEMQSPYYNETYMIPICEKTLMYQGNSVTTGKGISDYLYELSDDTAMWVVQNGETIIFESESVYEDYENTYTLADYYLIQEGKCQYQISDAYLLSTSNNVACFLKGNYIYAVGYDGTEYMKALHNILNND